MPVTNICQKKWPELAFESLKDTLATVQLWTQIVGKIRLIKTPWINHSWHVTLYVSPRGLTTGSIPYVDGNFQIDFDFVAHELLIIASNGKTEKLSLYPRTVASFYAELFEKLNAMGIEAKIYAKPNELDPAIPFAQDEVHKSYDAVQMNLYWQALININSVFVKFRSEFTGKCSPVHLFWGAFDLAVTRFSGREAPLHPGGAPNMPDRVMQEAYSHEVSSAGFWGGSEQFPHPAFYAYCYPTPADFGQQVVEPSEAFYSNEMGEFFLLYEVVQRSENPEVKLLQFLRSTYIAAAKTGNWDNKLQCDLTGYEK
ncbi:DUF5996 family protein [Mucilaginibacter sp. X5P1]|uniref:DUF5996 family protein n=1 Tax=Mucilaginibacter sp. X5P1 TaxID=2723088 RepID=UPI001610B468|nr:DUF5996 family protein [Mucilaginibacter sp. X5P1]MBB6141884.1 hypothetical protein [Mucilaginibacter sp. X5P1]